MDLNTAIDVIESVAGFADADTSVGEAWAVVMAQLNAAPAPAGEVGELVQPPGRAGLTWQGVIEGLRDVLNDESEDAIQRVWQRSRILDAISVMEANPCPAPAPAGEAGELVAWLTEQAVRAADCKQPMAAGMLTWAAQVVGEHTELLGRCHAASVAVLPDEAQVIEPTERTILVPVPAPVLVSERLPEPGVKVLAHYLNDMGKGRTICAIWVPAKYCSDDTDFADYDFTEYNDEDDKFYWPEGWYEAIENWDDFGWVKVNEGDVIYWQPLPKWPTTALPLPNGKVES